GFSLDESGCAAVGADPERTVAGLVDLLHVHLRRHPLITFNRREVFPPVVVAKGTAVDAEPKAAVFRPGEAADRLVPELMLVGKADEIELHAVEDDQSFLGSQPEIPVPGLGDGANAVDGQTILAGPVPAIVLVDAFCRVQSHELAR